MIKYHGTPIGGSKWDAIKFLNGRAALVSYAHPAQVREVLECCSQFCVDNGAFSVWKTTGGDIDFEGYRRFVDGLVNHPSFSFYIIPDKIGGTEVENDEMLSKWGCDRYSAPVYHLGESVDRFKRLADDFGLVCLGSTDKWPRNGSKSWWELMADFMDEVCVNGSFPCKVHGLRMLDPNLFKYIPLHSGDSTNAAINGGLSMDPKNTRYPCIERWQGSERIAQRIEAYQSPHVWDRSKLVEDGVILK